MLTIRKANDRGHTDWDWLDSRHTFSFGEYYDPNFMSFRHLRVINDDKIAPGGGFPTHPHQNMEIISFALEGALEHKDSLGNGSTIYPGEIQKMTAGSGIMHSEFNPSQTERAHFLQIWIYPDTKGLTPSYEQKKIDYDKAENRLLLIGAPSGTADAVSIHQDARLYIARVTSGKSVKQFTDPSRHYWLQVTKGNLEFDSNILSSGDGLGMSRISSLELTGRSEAEFLLFDLA